MGLHRVIQIVSLFYVFALFHPKVFCSPIRTLPFEIRALVYDSSTEKLYATSPSGLLQIDPNSGALLKTFPLGTNLSRLHLGGGNGLWVGVDGDGAVRRFRLDSLTAEDPIIVHSN